MSDADGKQQTTEFLNTVLGSVAHTFKVAIRTEVKPGKTRMRGPDEELTGDVAGLVGLISNHFTGSLTLIFPEKTYLAVMSRMLEVEFLAISEDIADGAAEIMNMILGHAKTTLNEKGYGFQQAIPSVIRGTGIQIYTDAQPSILIPYTSDAGDFYVELALKR